MRGALGEALGSGPSDGTLSVPVTFCPTWTWVKAVLDEDVFDGVAGYDNFEFIELAWMQE